MILPTKQVKNVTLSHHHHIVNNCLSWVDLILCTNQNVISKHGVNVSIFDKYHNIIYGNINIRVPLPPMYVREYVPELAVG